jgi:hypothetical protein
VVCKKFRGEFLFIEIRAIMATKRKFGYKKRKLSGFSGIHKAIFGLRWGGRGARPVGEVDPVGGNGAGSYEPTAAGNNDCAV